MATLVTTLCLDINKAIFITATLNQKTSRVTLNYLKSFRLCKIYTCKTIKTLKNKSYCTKHSNELNLTKKQDISEKQNLDVIFIVFFFAFFFLALIRVMRHVSRSRYPFRDLADPLQVPGHIIQYLPRRLLL